MSASDAEKSKPRGRVCENAGEWKAKAECNTSKPLRDHPLDFTE